MIAALLLRYWQCAALVAALSFGAIQWHRHNVAEQELGAARERVRVQDSTLKENAKQIARVDTVYRERTVEVVRYATKLQTLHDTVLSHLTDTVLVKQFVATSDSTVHACRDALSACDQFKILAEQRFAAYEAKIKVLPNAQRKGGIRQTLLHVAMGVLADETYHALARR